MQRIAVYRPIGDLQDVSKFSGAFRADDGDNDLPEQIGDGHQRGTLLREVFIGFGRIRGVPFCQERNICGILLGK
jgi:hypothetical protein